MSAHGKCLLCIIEAGPLADATPVGTYTIDYRDIAAVVRDVPLPAPQPTRADLMGHVRAIEQIMSKRTVIPVALGNIADSEEQVSQSVLASRYDEWRALLTRLAGKVELGLKALWKETAAVVAEVVAEREDIRALRDDIARRRQAATYQERIEVGSLVAEALADKKRREGEAILRALAPLAAEVQSGKLLGENMILNAAFLVERERESEFDGAVSCIAEDLRQRVAFRYVGPAPPFNFVGI